MSGEQITVSGRTSPHFRRTALLQRRTASGWSTVTRGKQSSKGRFALATSSRWEQAELRVVLPAAKVKRKRYAEIVTATTVVTQVAQAGVLVVPTWFEVGSSVTATAAFTPARRGRVVDLERQVGTSWTRVASAKTDASGHATFKVATPKESASLYRATVRAWHGAAKARTETVRAVAGQRQILDRTVTVAPGTTVPLDLTPTMTTVTTIAGRGDQPPGLSVALDGEGRVTVAATRTTAAGAYTLATTGVGCLGDTCEVGFTLTVEVGVVDPADVPADPNSFTAPSPDRVAAAVPLVGLPADARVLTDEVMIAVGTPSQPGSIDDARQVANQVGARVTGGLEAVGIFELTFDMPLADIEAMLTRLRSTDGVGAASESTLNAYRDAAVSTETPSDWSDDGEAVTWPFTDGKGGMRANHAWTTTRGSDVPVGIVDGGVAWAGHEDLDVANGLTSKLDPHSSHVAGLACARQNGKGIVGVAWGCPITSAGVSSGSDKDVLSAMVDVALTHPKVVNMSLGLNWYRCIDADENARTLAHARESAKAYPYLFNGPLGRNIVWTLSAGNNCGEGGHSWMAQSWALPNVITVAANNSDGTLASFSNWGPGVEVAAGGGVGVGIAGGADGVISTVRKDYCLLACSGYRAMAGTSMAAPLVAGVAALAFSARSDITAAEVGSCITNTAGHSTGRVTRQSDKPSSYRPKMTMTGSIPIVDAEATVACARGTSSVSADVLVAGQGDRTASGNGTDRGDLVASLTRSGRSVATSLELPTDLSGYRQVWYLDTQALTGDEQSRLESFVRAGHGVYLTGEWGCCPVDESSIGMINDLVTGAAVSHGGQTDGDVPVVADAPFDLGRRPKSVSTIRVATGGSLAGIEAANVVAAADGDDRAVAAAWGPDQVSGQGRIAIVMDINWVAEQYRGPEWEAMVANLSRFLEG